MPHRGRVQPCAVNVVADQDDRHRPAACVEQGPRRSVGPQTVLEAGSHEGVTVRDPTGADALGNQGCALLGRAGRAHLEAALAQRPHLHVHVVVPQPGDDGPTIEVDDLTTSRRRPRWQHTRNAPALHTDVDQPDAVGGPAIPNPRAREGERRRWIWWDTWHSSTVTTVRDRGTGPSYGIRLARLSAPTTHASPVVASLRQ